MLDWVLLIANALLTFVLAYFGLLASQKRVRVAAVLVGILSVIVIASQGYRSMKAGQESEKMQSQLRGEVTSLGNQLKDTGQELKGTRQELKDTRQELAEASRQAREEAARGFGQLSKDIAGSPPHPPILTIDYQLRGANRYALFIKTPSSNTEIITRLDLDFVIEGRSIKIYPDPPIAMDPCTSRTEPSISVKDSTTGQQVPYWEKIVITCPHIRPGALSLIVGDYKPIRLQDIPSPVILRPSLDRTLYAKWDWTYKGNTRTEYGTFMPRVVTN